MGNWVKLWDYCHEKDYGEKRSYLDFCRDLGIVNPERMDGSKYKPFERTNALKDALKSINKTASEIIKKAGQKQILRGRKNRGGKLVLIPLEDLLMKTIEFKPHKNSIIVKEEWPRKHFVGVDKAAGMKIVEFNNSKGEITLTKKMPYNSMNSRVTITTWSEVLLDTDALIKRGRRKSTERVALEAEALKILASQNIKNQAQLEKKLLVWQQEAG